MKKLTQKELKELYREGRVYLFDYKTRYEIDHERRKGFVLVKTGWISYGLPYTEKGTVRALTAKEAMTSVYVGSVDTILTTPGDADLFKKEKLGLIIGKHKNVTL